MLTICIPIYNFDVNQLVNALGQQIDNSQNKVDIILIDDESNNRYKEINKSSCAKYHYIELEDNIGRASIRNLFLQYARTDYLLFLDCDSLIIDDLFVAKYIEEINKNKESIICGGRVYSKESPGRSKILRWTYGVKNESQSAEIRRQEPNNSFMTNNFVIKKALLEQIKFDERLKDYGHEDTLFGFELKKKGILISHIENPVDNGDIEGNRLFIEKTEMGIESLIQILKFNKYDIELIQMIKLARVHKALEEKGLLWIITVIFLLTKPLIRVLLTNGCSSINLFNFYKLGLFNDRSNR